MSIFVTPAKAGVHADSEPLKPSLDPSFRWDDGV
jgi:hypothetical protein